MLCDKQTAILARATQNRGSRSFRDNLRRRNAGQSLIVTIIVLFVLLFLGGVFIALIANNIKNTRRGVRVSAASRFSEAGIKYLDEQLMTSAEGADWRPTPDCAAGVPCALSENDPDYAWLKPLDLNATTGEYEGGYTRINFGGPNSAQGSLGGRALVRVSYRPYRTNANGQYLDDNNVAFTSADLPDRTRRFIKLESVGRVGLVDSTDPTTYKNSEGKGLRRELVAYKSLGLTESLRFITDKDKRRPVATLGAPDPVQERSLTTAGENAATYLYGGQSYNAITGQFDTVTTGNAQILNRPIYSVYQGAIRSNTDLAFYGVNYLALDPRRGDSVSVAGAIHLNGIGDTTATLTATDPTKVYLVDSGTSQEAKSIPTALAVTAVSVATLGGTTKIANVLPSGAASFTTFDGFVRDNPRGNETQGLPEAANLNNLRAVPRLEPPVIDAAIGDNGLTRYRALTRDSAPLSSVDTGSSTNPADTNLAVLIDPRFAGSYGWGQNLYIPNGVDLPAFSETIANNVSSSQRAEWLSPRIGTAPGINWRTDGLYTPPAVSITLTPRYYALNQSTTAQTRSRSYLRRPDFGRTAASTSRPLETVYRFTYDTGVLNTAPVAGIDGVDPATVGITAPKFAGYPASKAGKDGILGNADDTPYYEGDLVIFAEGNIRIKGAVGGYDPESKQTFVRHLTVVSNGTVYIDGSVLRDNISPEMAAANPTMRAAKGKSTIALLAKNYIAVNTTQFLSPNDNTKAIADPNATAEVKSSLLFNSGTDERETFSTVFAPIVSYNTSGLADVRNVFNAVATQDLNRVPPYLTDTVNAPLSLLLRHASLGKDGTTARLAINPQDPATSGGVPLNYYNWPYGNPLPATTKELSFGANKEGEFTSNVFQLNDAPNAPYLYPTNGYPYTPTGTLVPTLGLSNFMEIRHGGASSTSSTTPTPYLLNRFGIVPLDIRIEALMYAQEGSFFIIPGAGFNPNSNDTFKSYMKAAISNPTAPARDAAIVVGFPFYGEPLDIRITMFGAITENLPAEIGDQGAWLQKWGWIPRYRGSTGLPSTPADAAPTFHGSAYTATANVSDGVGNGINYIYDPRLAAPYDSAGAPLRRNPNFVGIVADKAEPLPPMPRLPVAPGLLYYGERSVR